MRRRFLAHGALFWGVCLGLGAAGEAPVPPLAIYSGGAYDGWAMDAAREPGTLPGPRVRLSWGADHFFDMRTVFLSAPDLTIQESDNPDALGIRRGNTMRLAFPDLLNLRWRIDELTYGGSAAAKAGAATLAGNDAVIQIPITADFAADETLVLENLVLAGCHTTRQMRGRLRLDYDDDGIWDAYDAHLFTLGMVWTGGAYDGWTSDQARKSATLRPQATLILLR